MLYVHDLDAVAEVVEADAVVTEAQTFQYDGFGNMTAKTLNGTTTQQLPVNSATNRLTYATYDANGNMFSGAGATLYYDGANRLAVAAPTGGGWTSYAYDASNRRVGDIGHFTFYGAQGEKLGVYSIEVCGTSCGGTNTYIAALSSNVWFGGHLIIDSSAAVFQDRLGTNRTGGARFYPYGEEITSPQTANDRVKFGTYTRDSFTGLDYAQQRFYASSYGRFNTPDPYKSGSGSGTPSDPASWNKYAYVEGDPINEIDPTGEFMLAPPIDWSILWPFYGFFGPQQPQRPVPADPPTDFPECNPGGNATTEKKLNFINDNFADALNAANNFEQGAPGSKVSATALATMFLQWSIGESGYPGDNAQVSAENNWFGFQKGGAGAWSGLEINCPQSSAIPGNSTNACFSMDTSWGQELGAALGTVSSKTGTTYGQALENALGAGVSSTAAALQAIANNGWNGSSTYGANKTSQISVTSQVNCLIKNGYVP